MHFGGLFGSFRSHFRRGKGGVEIESGNRESVEIESCRNRESVEIEFGRNRETLDIEYDRNRESAEIEFGRNRETVDIEYDRIREMVEIEYGRNREMVEYRVRSCLEIRTFKSRAGLSSPRKRPSFCEMAVCSHKEKAPPF